jgi:hypothetical protein
MSFEIEVTAGPAADVHVDATVPIPETIVAALDARHIRAIAPVAVPTSRTAAAAPTLHGCSGVVCAAPDDETAVAATALGLPCIAADVTSPSAIEDFCRAVLAHHCAVRRYAFFIGRLERDFALAREAIRAAVEDAAGLDFLWVDDGRHVANVPGVRDRTRLLIQHAVFVVADLTLGVENPVHENPSRAHEIGIAIGYGRPICLSSQEPRRYPYFSIADMQMTFWTREDELEASVRAWIHGHRRLVARRVLNYSLPSPVLAPSAFRYDPARRFVGPNLANDVQDHRR